MSDPFDALRGNEELKKFLKNEIDRKTLAHAYILEGSEGTGKHTAARAAASYLAKDLPGGDKIARGISPDVVTFAPPPDKKQFNVDTVRLMREQAYLLPAELPFKVFILEKTEMMNNQAQNAALKILEEPPANTYFFLLCDNAAALLPTVRSRAPVLRMQRFSSAEIEAYLRADPELSGRCEGEKYELAVKNCAGSYGLAKYMLKNEEDAGDRAQALDLLGSRRYPVELLKKMQKFPKTRDQAADLLALLQKACRDLLLLRSGGGEEDFLFFFSENEAAKYGRDLSRDEIFLLYDRITKLADAAAKNVNLRNLQFALYSAFTS